VPRWHDDHIARMKAGATSLNTEAFVALMARVRLLGAAAQFAEARELLHCVSDNYPPAAIGMTSFRSLLVAGILMHCGDLAEAWLLERFRCPYKLKIDIAESGGDPRVAHLRVSGNEAWFLFADSLFSWANSEQLLGRWVDTYPLFDAFMTSSHRTDGSVDLNLSDIGVRPGLTFSDYRPGYYLIPDPDYMSQERYTAYKAYLCANPMPWDDRLPVAFWRGATTGMGKRAFWRGSIPDTEPRSVAGEARPDPLSRWRGAPRIRVCQISRANPGIIDAGITDVVEIVDPTFRAGLESLDLLRPHVPSHSFQKYRYQIDIDGHSNAWSGLFRKLLTGSPVLKVASGAGFRQWYYDRLRPWANYIPVAEDMGDLVEKVVWLRAHDEVARRIGEAGRDLAEALTGEQEILAAASVFAVAMRAAASQ